MVDEVELVVRSKQRSKVVEPIPLGNLVSQLAGVWLTCLRMNLDIEVVGEYFLGLAQAGSQEEKTEGGDDISLVEEHNKGT